MPPDPPTPNPRRRALLSFPKRFDAVELADILETQFNQHIRILNRAGDFTDERVVLVLG